MEQLRTAVSGYIPYMYVHNRTNKTFHVEHISILHAC